MLGIYFDEYYELSDAKRKKNSRYDPDNVFLKACKYNIWFENEQSIDTTRKKWYRRICTFIWHATNRKWWRIKKRKALNVLTPNKSLTKLPILFVKIKAANNSCKLKNEIIQIL